MQRRSSQSIFTTSKLARTIAVFAFFALKAAANAEDLVLSWTDDSDNEDGFNIERAIGDGPFEEFAQVGTNVETYTDTTAIEGVDYKYRVNAFNIYGSSDYSNVASHYINVAPTLTAFQDVAIEENETSAEISFTVSDIETASSELNVSVASSNSGLLNSSDVVLQGTGAERAFTLTPELNASGESVITVTVSDGEDSISREFLLTVSSYDFPTLQLAIESITSSPRAGESFTVQTSASDNSDIASISYWIDEELVETVSSAPYEASLVVTEQGSYTITAVASIVGRAQTVMVDREVVISAAPTGSDMANHLATQSVEDSSNEGSASYDLASDTFTLEDLNGEIGGISDSHRYYYLQAQGDVSIEAQVSSLEAGAGSTVAGLMVRSALYGKSPQASLLLNGNSELSVRTRTSRGSDTQVRAVGASGSASPWLRIEKTSSSVRYYTKASSGDSWSLVASDALALGEKVFLGFALAGGSTQGIVAADFTRANFDGAVVVMGDDAVKPNIPSGLLISSK
ncbi:Ig-like domain-containing protein [Pelagicoccus sp. SDUM812002]|uniref:Ig-like domain-containing protein n=1 Tax=Pelagicoccus sp. SDUM812002 TaxID=3041266 RepID=UPI00280F1FCF|nr:Ig-like domain-containing protein [Pelagicoccus sp. SDUM812002]MDQ8187522.1 Ig-like domain-containing protein [Pelagicoccus sp. SDUM812002]